MEIIIFRNKEGEKLSGILSEASKDKIVILCHGFTSSKDSSTYTTLEKEINNLGISTFRFDFSGHGESEGDIKELTIRKGVEEIKETIKICKDKNFKEIILLGSSRGGVCALRAAENQKLIKLLILIAPGSEHENYQERNEIAKEIKVPTLIIQGENDEVVSLEVAEELNMCMINSQLKIIKNGKHGFSDTPGKKEERIKLIIKFIEEKNK